MSEEMDLSWGAIVATKGTIKEKWVKLCLSLDIDNIINIRYKTLI